MNDVEVREYHNDTRVVHIRRGMETSSRPYTDEENAEADAQQLLETNEATLNSDATASIAALEASIVTLQAIKDKPNTEITAIDTKNAAREARKVAQQVVRLTRLMVKAFEKTDVGTA